MVVGAVITDGVIIQRLTESRIAHVARILYILSMSLEKLCCCYENLQHPARYFLSITAYRESDEIVYFEYLFFIIGNDSACNGIRARIYVDPAQDIVVKFFDRYWERAGACGRRSGEGKCAGFTDRI
jgi:hypothetical protein